MPMAAVEVSFDELERLSRSLETLRHQHVTSLRQYYNDVGHGFLHEIGGPKKADPSKSSTSTCVNSLIATSKWTKQRRSDEDAWIWEREIDQIYEKNLTGDWKSGGQGTGNPFTAAFVLEAALDLESINSSLKEKFPELRTKAHEIIKQSIETGRVHLEKYPPSAYLTQLVLRVLKRVETVASETARLVYEWAIHEVVYQQALFQSGSKSADTYQLCYSIILASDTVSSDRLTPDHKLLIAKGLEQFFERQLPDGSWPRSQPLFHYPSLGNAHCYEYELLSQLLATPSLSNLLLRHLEGLTKAADALENTKFKVGDGAGWSSGHHPQSTGPESWTTASVYLFAHRLDRLVAEAVRRQIFEDLREPYSEPGSPRKDRNEFAAKFLDCPLSYENHVRSLRALLFEHFVEPIARDADLVRDGGRLDDETPMSAIFYGPPGTSKTELAKQIAEYLRWPLLPVDPSYFVREGLDRIQAQANKLFQMLAICERTVVLFDEFDEMVRDRANAEEALSRFLTTAMLPKLATINKKRRIVFVVATNFITGFDRAISRAGRFDLVAQIMPPTFEAKVQKWGVLNCYEAPAAKAKIADLTYLECEALAKTLEHSVTPEDRKKLLQRHFKDCTLSSPNKALDPAESETRGEQKKKKSTKSNGAKLAKSQKPFPTWKETSQREASLVRIPLVPPPAENQGPEGS
jgi:hypothetical protein